MLKRLAPHAQRTSALCLPVQSDAAQAFQDRGARAELAFALEGQEEARTILKFQVGSQQARITAGAHAQDLEAGGCKVLETRLGKRQVVQLMRPGGLDIGGQSAIAERIAPVQMRAQFAATQRAGMGGV